MRDFDTQAQLIADLKLKGKQLAQHLENVLKEAYHSGREDLRGELRDLLGVPSHHDLHLLEEDIHSEYHENK